MALFVNKIFQRLLTFSLSDADEDDVRFDTAKDSMTQTILNTARANQPFVIAESRVSLLLWEKRWSTMEFLEAVDGRIMQYLLIGF